MASLRAFGKYLPSRVVGNDAFGDLDPAWILQSTGITQRRYAAEDETVVSMGVRAAQDGGVEGVGLVIVSSGTAPKRFPGPAAAIARELGMAGVPAIDLPM